MKAKSSKVYKQRVIVQLSGTVPFDMLRYDRCTPARETEAGKLERVAHGSASPEDHTVEFLRFAFTPDGPTEARWRSFNCRIVSWEPLS